MDRLGSCLDDVQSAVRAIFGELHVHWRPIVLLDNEGPARELEHFVIAQAQSPAIVRGDQLVVVPTGRAVEHETLLLRSNFTPQDRAVTRSERGLVDIVFIGADASLHDVLAKAVDRVDLHDIAKPGLGVEREHHTGDGPVAPQHSLHADGQADRVLVNTHIVAIPDRARGIEAGKARPHPVQDVRLATDIEERLVGAGEARAREILRGR